MKIPTRFRLKPLVTCLATALALAPVGELVASDHAHPLAAANTQPAGFRNSVPRKSKLAYLLADAGSARKRPSLQEVVAQLAAQARAARPYEPPRAPANLPVTSCDDSGPGTLREVLTAAVSGDVVDLTGLSCSTISLTTGAITTTADDVTIQGPGRAALAIDGGQQSGLINHYGAGTISVEGLTLSNGYIQGYAYHGGACVLSSGNITLADSTASSCTAYTAHAYGGALCAVGNITLSNATLSGNITRGHFYIYYYPGYPNPYTFNGTSRGGGAYAAGRFTITNSTIAFNQATYNNRGSSGGGFSGHSGDHLISGSTIYGNYAWLAGGFSVSAPDSEAASLSVLNSTISGNSAAISSGGFNTYRIDDITLHNSTVTGNAAPYCGGVYLYYGAADIKSSIIAGNTSLYAQNQFGYYSAADLDSFFGYAIISGDHNVIVTSNAPVPVDTITEDPLLLPLADNGGPTQTHALDSASIAIDAGSNPDGLNFDQRGDGFAREVGAAADIGAFESPPAVVDVIFTNGFDGPS